MGDTTDLNQLPMPPNKNVSFSTQEMPNQESNNVMQYQDELSKTIQKAALDGGTQLPSKDIPMETTNITNDPNVKPNYLPSPPSDYIGDYDSEENVLSKNNKLDQNLSTFDQFFNEFQVPIIIAILYFIFQLPFINQNIMRISPNLFNKSGNLNNYGMIFKSILYGIMYYSVTKAADKLSKS